jgi:cob(I)alamin adenosyltransferase
MEEVKKGYIQVYTGDGKGKTTAALGLILRASGAGLRVYLGQFIKGRRTNEIKTLKARFPNVTVRQYGRGGFIRGKPSPEHVKAARKGLAQLRRAMLSRRYDLVIADEANVAVALGLLPAPSLLDLMDEKPESVELVVTGRKADRRVVARADLVTEMREIKHYFRQGVPARPGIEM